MFNKIIDWRLGTYVYVGMCFPWLTLLRYSMMIYSEEYRNIIIILHGRTKMLGRWITGLNKRWCRYKRSLCDCVQKKTASTELRHCVTCSSTSKDKTCKIRIYLAVFLLWRSSSPDRKKFKCIICLGVGAILPLS